MCIHPHGWIALPLCWVYELLPPISPDQKPMRNLVEPVRLPARWEAPQALWSAAASCRFSQASLLAATAPMRGQQAGLRESGSKLPYSRAFLVVALLLFIAALAQSLHGQTWNSHLEGMVLDPSGAVVSVGFARASQSCHGASPAH